MENGKKEVAAAEQSRPKKHFWTLDYNMLPYKMHFFLFLGAMAGVLPYKTIYLKEVLGLSGTNLATLLTTQQFLVILTKPVIGVIVDYFNKLKAVIITFTVAQAVLYLSLLWIPGHNHNASLNHHANGSDIDDIITISGNEQVMDNSTIRKDIAVSATRYWIFCICYVCGGISSNAMFTLSDTACYESLEKTGSDYGKQRMWGSLSWGIMAPIAGFLSDFATGSSEQTDYSPGFYLMTALCILMILNVMRLDLVKPDLKKNALHDVKKVFSSIEFVVFVCSVFVIGIFTGLIWFYMMIYLESIGASGVLLGLILTCQCFLGEVPFMFVSGWFVRKIGHINILALTMSTFFVRFMCYSYIMNPWYILPVEICHGLTFGVFFAAMTAFAKLSAPPGTETTTQAVLGITFEGFGAGLGSLIGGIGFDVIGSRQTYFVAGLASLAATILQIIACLCLRARKKSLDVKKVYISTVSSDK